MKKLFHTVFSAFSIIRVLSFIAIFVLHDLWRNSIPDTGAFSNLEIDFEFSIWEKLVIYGLPIALIGNSIIWLIFTFKPSWLFRGVFKNKLLLRIFYWAELLCLPYFLYLGYEQVRDEFFPEDYGAIGDFLSLIFPPKETITDTYQRLEIYNFCLLIVCSLLFVLFFWKFYKAAKLKYEMAEAGTLI